MAAALKELGINCEPEPAEPVVLSAGEMRVKMGMLDADYQYLLYCESGRQSSIATYLLSQEGFDSFALQGSMKAVPEAEME